MTSGSRNTRVDQFFPSKKVKCLSPSGKVGKASKDSKSPNIKGSLHGYLVKALDNHTLQDNDDTNLQLSLIEGSVAKPTAVSVENKVGLLSRKSQTIESFSLLPCSSYSGIPLAEDVEGQDITLEHKSEEHLSLDKRAVIYPDTGVPSSSSIVNNQCVNNNDDSRDLNHFADSFLAMCCSGFVSTEGPTSLEHQISESIKRQKRSGSPTQLSANKAILKKKQCGIIGNSLSELLTESINASEDKHEEGCQPNVANDFSSSKLSSSESEIHEENNKGCLVTNSQGQALKMDGGDKLDLCIESMENQKTQKPVNISGGKVVACVQYPALTESPVVKNCFGTHEKSLCTPETGDIKSKSVKTPAWAYRSSLSPGDEFWNEAIQLADGLVAVKSNSAIESANENLICEQIQESYLHPDTVDIRKTNDNNNQRKSKNGTSNTQGEKIVEDHNYEIRETDEDCEKRENENTVRWKSFQNRDSFPIKHFDFSFEDQNLGKGAGGLKIPKHFESVVADIKLQNEGESLIHPDSDKLILGSNQSDSSVTNRSHVNDPTNNVTTAPSSTVASKEGLELTKWLPQKVCDVYLQKGITSLYPWQVDCLQLDGVLERRNLVYCASTSAGKSLVAEVLLLKRVLSTDRKAMLVLPFVSLCAEKAEHLEKLLEPFNKRVRSFYGSQGGATLPKDTSVAVCTIEKANSLVNKLLEEGRIGEVGIMVIDELHMVGDLSRGYLLELLLTKLRFASGDDGTGTNKIDSPGNTSGKSGPTSGMQIVGMSATMPNVSSVANWLQAALYETEFRPVPLDEYIKIGNSVYNKEMEVIRTLPKGADLGGKDPDHVVELCNEVVQGGNSVLLFCSSRKACETTAKHIAKFIKEVPCKIAQVDKQSNNALVAIDDLKKCPSGLDPILAETLPAGVAYHHAGLTVEEREIIETGYRQGIIKVLTATSTLAAGVNLPARRVIFRQPRIGRDFLDGTRYRQMSGRAGRAGIDTKGESIVICKPDELKRVKATVNDSCPPLQSCLAEDKNGMTRAILEVVAGGIVQTAHDVHRYVRCTLLSCTQPFEDVVKSAQESLYWLCHAKFVEWNQQTQMYTVTPLGRAAFGSSLSPEESMVVFEDLTRAREGFVLASDLHLLYQVTPINIELEPDWELYYQRFMELSPVDKAVGNRVGVMEPFLMRMAHGAPVLQTNGKVSKSKKSPHAKSIPLVTGFQGNNILPTDKALRVSRRFYVALMLAQLVQEISLNDVCEAFKVARGMIQALQENAGRFASMLCAFCERLGWHDLEGLFSKFQNRVSFGVRAEIAELTSIPFVKGARARALFKSGLRTPQAVAEASLQELVQALFQNDSRVAQDGSSSNIQYRIQMGVAKKIKNGARQIVLDQAEEARLAAFTAFTALGVSVPVALSQPVNAWAAGFANDKEKAVLLLDQEISEHTNDYKVDCVSNNKSKECILTIERKSIIANGGEGNPESTTMRVPLDKTNNDREHCTQEEPKSNQNFIAGNGLEESAQVFAGGKSILEPNQENFQMHDRNTIMFDEGPVDVDKLSGGFDFFIELWKQVDEFFFDMHFAVTTERESLFEAHGLAVCWKDSPLYYVNFNQCIIVTNEEHHNLFNRQDSSVTHQAYSKLNTAELAELAIKRWDRILEVMQMKDTRKVTWGFKRQLQAFQNAIILIPLDLNYTKADTSSTSDAVLGGKSVVSLPAIHIEQPIDICIAAWMLWPDEESTYNPSLEQEVRKRLPGEFTARANRAGRWMNQMSRVAQNGCCRRAAQIRALHLFLWRLIVTEGLHEVFQSVEMPLVRVLVDMEYWGVGINMEICWKARRLIEKKLKELEDRAYKLAGTKFSLTMPADVANVLYGILKLPVLEGCKKGKQHPSTDKHALDLLRKHHPVVGIIKEHRTLLKLLQCTIISVLSRAKLSVRSQVHCVYGHWLQTSTATGRLSMEEPNLQRVEHEIDLTLESESGGGTDEIKLSQYQINARDIFVPTEENWILMSADYSQIELRLMAHFSEDALLLSILRESDGDVFMMMAAKWTGKKESEITERQRDETKKLVYGILYGMGINTLAEHMECGIAEASERYDRFKSVFPGLSSWLQHAIDCCRQRGHIKTLNGRKRFLGKINFGNRGEQAKAERQAVNSICQGSAADIIKCAMLKVHNIISGEVSVQNKEVSSINGSCFSKLKGNCHLLLQIHDELLLEVKPALLKEAVDLVRDSMENAASLKVPLRVKIHVGKTWGSMQPYHVTE